MAHQKPTAVAKLEEDLFDRLPKVDLSQGCSVISPLTQHTHTYTHIREITPGTSDCPSDTSVHYIHSLACVFVWLWVSSGNDVHVSL